MNEGERLAEPQAYTDGPNTHKYSDATFVTNWTLVNLDDVNGITHHFHVPTAIADIFRAEGVRLPGEGGEDPVEAFKQRLIEKAEKWRAEAMFTDSEWGAVCAVLFVQDMALVSDAERQRAREIGLRMVERHRVKEGEDDAA